MIRALSWFSSLKIKKFPKYQPPNVCGSVEIRMCIMSKNSTTTWCTNIDVCKENCYICIISAPP
jgi:hypothetical protein